jgi:hypothetical protein
MQIGWEKPHTAFVEVVEGTEIYNFAIYHLVHFCYKIVRKSWSTVLPWNSLRWNTLEREHAHDVAPSHVSLLPYLAVHACRGSPASRGSCAALFGTCAWWRWAPWPVHAVLAHRPHPLPTARHWAATTARCRSPHRPYRVPCHDSL